MERDPARHKPTWIWCAAHNKRTHWHKKAAKKAAREINPGKKKSTFWCYESEGWHVGELPAGVKWGIYSRDDLLNRPRRTA